MHDPPHDHGCWAAIGVYAGEEASVAYERSVVGGPIEATGRHSLTAGEVTVLDADVIHAVTNPLSSWTGAIHVYAVDFLSPTRRERDPSAWEERAWDAGASLERYAAAVAAAGG